MQRGVRLDDHDRPKFRLLLLERRGHDLLFLLHVDARFKRFDRGVKALEHEGGRLIAFRRIELHRLIDDVGDASRNVRRDLADRLDVLETRGVKTLRSLFDLSKRRDPRKELIINGAKEIEVAALIVARDVRRAFKRGVLDRALRFETRAFVREQTKIEKHRLPRAGEQNVRKLHVAVLESSFERVI